jgi:predicted aconitase
MKNNFEKFVQKNRRDFDSEVPGDKVWENIEKNIPVKKEAKHFSINDIIKWSAAAAILFATLTAVYFIYIKKNNPEKPVIAVNPPAAGNNVNQDDISGLAPEQAAEIKEIYNSIANGQQELKTAASGQPRLYQQFLSDLAVLDSSYRSLRKQALVTPNRDVIIKAMMQNLQLQAELIYRQLMITNEIKKQKTNQNEKAI